MATSSSRTKKPKKRSRDCDPSSSLATAQSLLAYKWPDLYFALYFHQTTHGESLDFGRGRYILIDLYKDDSQRLVIMKGVQLGITDRVIIATLSRLHRGWAVLYSFPTEQFRNEQIAERIDPLLKTVPFYRTGLKQARGGKDEFGMKHMWQGTVRFVGSNSKVSFVGYAADMVVVDEKDKSDLENLKMAPDRVDASEHKYIWQLGNPTYPNFGIHKDYIESDQKAWHIKCEHCNEWQALDFFVNVVREIQENEYRLLDTKWTEDTERDIQVYCRKCGLPLDRLAMGEHVARHPDREVSGYHLSQLTSPTKTIREIYENLLRGLTDPTEMQLLYNSRLGLPYEGVGDKLSAALLEAKCKDDYLMPSTARNCTAGIDVNWPQLNVRISDYPQRNIRRAVYIGVVYSFKDLSDLLKRYDVKTACIDVAPERHKVAEFQKVNPRIWAIQYSSSEVAEFWRPKKEEKYVTVDRTQAIDAMVSEILNERNRLPKNFRGLDSGHYIEQMEAPQRILDRTKNPPRHIWDEQGNADHHFHADVYDYLAMRISREFAFDTQSISGRGERSMPAEMDEYVSG